MDVARMLSRDDGSGEPGRERAGPSLTAAVPKLRDDDLSVMLYTSGITGKPKGVPRTHGAEHAAGAADPIAARYIRP
jgi:2-furoate---CoA ligase